MPTKACAALRLPSAQSRPFRRRSGAAVCKKHHTAHGGATASTADADRVQDTVMAAQGGRRSSQHRANELESNFCRMDGEEMPKSRNALKTSEPPTTYRPPHNVTQPVVLPCFAQLSSPPAAPLSHFSRTSLARLSHGCRHTMGSASRLYDDARKQSGNGFDDERTHSSGSSAPGSTRTG
jgi:hypothetical protein